MRGAGAILMVIGVIVAVIAFLLNTTVSLPGAAIAPYTQPTSTHNLGLLQQQMMVLHTGLAVFIAGAFLFGSGAILEQVSGDRRNSPASAEQSAQTEEGHQPEPPLSWEMIAMTVGALVIAAALFVMLVR